MDNYIKCTLQGSIATVTIDRPQVLNSLNRKVLDELHQVMDELNQNPAVRVVILTGAGEKSFVAGADIGEMRNLSAMEAGEWGKRGQAVMNRIASMRPVVIAAINGYALGGGCELAAACDIRVASQKAKIGIPEVSLGVFPGFGGTQRLPRLIGLGRALEMLATGRQITAEEAYGMGLVNYVVAPEELMIFCKDLAEKILVHSASAITLGKQAMTAGIEMDLDKGLAYEAGLFAVSFSTQDQQEGMSAFLEKRPAKFD